MRVLIVDDSNTICHGLQAIFASIGDIEVVAFAYNGIEAIEKATAQKPDMIIIDVLMPVMGGIEATKEITKRFPKLKVVVYSSFEDLLIIREAIAAGAKGYLFKELMGDEIVRAIRSVSQGDLAFPPEIISQLSTIDPAIKKVNFSFENVKTNSGDVNKIRSDSTISNKFSPSNKTTEETEKSLSTKAEESSAIAPYVASSQKEQLPRNYPDFKRQGMIDHPKVIQVLQRLFLKMLNL